MSLQDEIANYTGNMYNEQKLGSLSNAILSGIYDKNPNIKKTSRAFRIWNTIGDERIRKHCNGFSFRDRRDGGKELVVYIDSNIWMYELKMRSFELLKEWNVRCSQQGQADLAVQSIQFKLSKKARESGYSAGYSNHDGEVSQPESLPLSPEEYEEAVRMVSCIKDESLREHALRAMISVKEWKKSSQN
jgi:hypothetical protein